MTKEDPELFIADKSYYLSTWLLPGREIELAAIPVQRIGGPSPGFRVELVMSESVATKGPRYAAQSEKDPFSSRQVTQICLPLHTDARDVERLRAFIAKLGEMCDEMEKDVKRMAEANGGATVSIIGGGSLQ